MAFLTIPNTFVNGTTADGTEVNSNFSAVVNATSDGTKDLNVSAITLAGVLTANGNAVLGSDSADTLTVNATPTFAAATTFSSTVTIGSDSADSFASGTEMVFYQAAAPTGWTINSAISDRMLLNDHAAGGTTGGSWDSLSHSHAFGQATSGSHSIEFYTGTFGINPKRTYQSANYGAGAIAAIFGSTGGTINNGDDFITNTPVSLTHGSTQHNWAKVIIAAKD